jgi:hypothetical protein
VYGQQAIRESMQRPHKRSAEDLFSHNAMSWMDLVHQLDSRTRGPASGYPSVVMVEPTDDRKSEHLIPCILSGRNRAAPFRYLLLDPLMRSCPVEVHHVLIEHTLELLLAEDQQVVQALRKKAKSGRKRRSVTCKKSHAQICAV